MLTTHKSYCFTTFLNENTHSRYPPVFYCNMQSSLYYCKEQKTVRWAENLAMCNFLIY